MKKLKSIIVDYEPKNLELLSYFLEKYSTDTEIVGSFSENRAALEYLENEDNLSELDIIFLILYWMRVLALIFWTISIIQTYRSSYALLMTNLL